VLALTPIGVCWQSASRAHFLGLAPRSSNVSLTPACKTVMAEADGARNNENVTSRCGCRWSLSLGVLLLSFFTSFPLSSHLFSVLAGCMEKSLRSHPPRFHRQSCCNLQRLFTCNLIIWYNGMRRVLPAPPLPLLQYQVPCLRPRPHYRPQLFLAFHHSW
jgi:hypothetical protein